MIFVDLKVESVAQLADKVRLDATRSFVSKGDTDVAKVEIEPEADAGFIDVTGDSSADWFLDWAYATKGTKTVTVRITTEGEPVTSAEATKNIKILDEAEDNLLSADEDLVSLESDVMHYLPEGRSSWKFMHRKAQSLIIEYLDRIGFTDSLGNRLTSSALVSTEEYRAWSKFLVLRLIYFDLSNQPEDNWWQKAKEYQKLEEAARGRVRLPIDLDGDGAPDQVLFDSIRINLR